MAVSANATTYDWSFTDQNGAAAGKGTLDMTDNVVVTKMTGTLYGSAINFYPNKPVAWTSAPRGVTLDSNDPVPGETTAQNVPNTTGANYSYDDIYNFENGVTYVGGILISTGSGSTLRVYVITRDNSNYDITTPTDFFSINKDGSYSSNNGTFTVTVGP
jgi:hypothetical protein